MRKLKNIIAIVAVCLTTFMIQSLRLQAEETKQTAILTEQNKNHQKPSMPSRQRIICTYSRGNIELGFNYSEYLDVTISNEDIPVWSGTVTQDEPSADIPVLYGEHTITCITDGGHIFTGYLSF